MIATLWVRFLYLHCCCFVYGLVDILLDSDNVVFCLTPSRYEKIWALRNRSGARNAQNCSKRSCDACAQLVIGQSMKELIPTLKIAKYFALLGEFKFSARLEGSGLSKKVLAESLAFHAGILSDCTSIGSTKSHKCWDIVGWLGHASDAIYVGIGIYDGDLVLGFFQNFQPVISSWFISSWRNSRVVLLEKGCQQKTLCFDDAL